MERKRINRLKVVLAEKGMTNKQLSEILDKDPAAPCGDKEIIQMQ